MDTDVLLFANPKEILDYLDQQDQYQVTTSNSRTRSILNKEDT